MSCAVLVVDDERMVRFTLEKVLRAGGYEVVTADSGEACLEVVRGGFRGVILMDVMMPGLDGWDTLAVLDAEGLLDGNPVCMVTAVREPERKMEQVKEVVFDYLRKPFRVPELLARVEELSAYVARD